MNEKLQGNEKAALFNSASLNRASEFVTKKSDLITTLEQEGYEDYFASLLRMSKEERPVEGVHNISDGDWVALTKLFDSLPE